MKKIFVIGAGRSATSLIEYLLSHAEADETEITVGDVDEDLAKEKTKGHPFARPIAFDISDEVQTSREINRADLVISLLPAHMHLPVAKACVAAGKSMVTASYITPEMRELHDQAVSRNVLLLNECGLDPGIDHMSAMQIISDIKSNGGQLEAFYSYTGGLVAPESNDNPWGYKFSWNPRNVILAGQGTARYIENGQYKYIPYNRLFNQAVSVAIPGAGVFDGYANRDSLSYRTTYGIESIPTLLRGTLRQSGFCKAWQVFVQLGLTDDSYLLENVSKLTYADLIRALLPEKYNAYTLQAAVADLCDLDPNGSEMEMVEWTGIFSDTLIRLPKASPAQVLQFLLEEKWKLREGDKDMVVMQHRFVFMRNGKKVERLSSLVVIGDDQVNTAMAKTVGLPVGIAARQVMKGNIREKGVQLPILPNTVQLILTELARLGISFNDQEVELP